MKLLISLSLGYAVMATPSAQAAALSPSPAGLTASANSTVVAVGTTSLPDGESAVIAGSASAAATNAGNTAATPACTATRPTVLFNRWQENWAVLANPCVPKKPFDSLKYIPLFGDSGSYLSLGMNLRERMEFNDAPLFGTGSGKRDLYFIQRTQVHADLHLGSHVQFFVQMEDARPFGKNAVTPVDKDPLDLEQAFGTVTGNLGSGTYKVRIGRQEMAFDLQRFIAVRDGPNVRQAFDGVWADWENGPWRFIAYATQPVQYRFTNTFNDTSNRDVTFSGVRVERQNVGPGDVSAYYSRYNRTKASFLDGAGAEHRDVFDMRYSGKAGGFDYDVEGMYQSGHVAQKVIGAWAMGSLGGYTFASLPWAPRIGLQVDAASGDRHPGDNRIGTFNPLFPNGYYFSLAGYTGYTNVIHVKPSITLHPSNRLTLLTALGLQWRETTADAVYGQGSAVVPGTAGRGTHWTGAYVQIRADWTIAANLIGSVEAVHFKVGNSLRSAGASNADYVGVEMKYGW